MFFCFCFFFKKKLTVSLRPITCWHRTGSTQEYSYQSWGFIIPSAQFISLIRVKNILAVIKPSYNPSDILPLKNLALIPGNRQPDDIHTLVSKESGEGVTAI